MKKKSKERNALISVSLTSSFNCLLFFFLSKFYSEEYEIDNTRGKWSQMIMELIDKINPKEENSDEK